MESELPPHLSRSCNGSASIQNRVEIERLHTLRRSNGSPSLPPSRRASTPAIVGYTAPGVGNIQTEPKLLMKRFDKFEAENMVLIVKVD